MKRKISLIQVECEVRIKACKRCGEKVFVCAPLSPHANCMDGSRMVRMEDGKYSELSQYEESWVRGHKDCACAADKYRCGWCRYPKTFRIKTKSMRYVTNVNPGLYLSGLSDGSICRAQRKRWKSTS